MGSAEAEALARLLDGEEDQIDLGRAALRLARLEYPDLDIEAEASRLDVLAAEAGRVAGTQEAPAERLAALRFFLSETCGFCGNEHDYYDPKNSFLNDVLDRRTGLPITLSVVYMETARRLGLVLFGVGLPGHFVVKHQDTGGVQFLDPFHDGRTLSVADCRRIVSEISGGGIEFREDMLAAVPKKHIVLRMVNNLRGVYLQRRQFRKVLALVEVAMALEPGSSEDLKQRGLLHYQLRNYRQARLDLGAYLSAGPQGPDTEEIRETLAGLRRLSAMLN
jgi:regulator of sirC expression with transglutaminase-like and TPR domain